MRSTAAIGVVLCGLVGSFGCRPRTSVLPPDIPLVSVTYERHLQTARQCSHRGVTNSAYEATELGANILLVFYGVTNSMTTTSGVVTTTTVTTGFWAQALRCPEKLVRSIRELQVQ